jgi:protein-disulfide isomerase
MIGREFAAAVLAAALLGAAAVPALGQGIPADTGQQILQELRAIRQLLEAQQRDPARAAAPRAGDDRIGVAFQPDGLSLGRADAPLVMVEYTDYECPFCRQFHLTSFEQIRKNYIDAGKLRYVSRDFPLDIHKNALRAAVAGRCGAEQGKFWELRHTMIANASQLKPEHILGYAKDLNLDLGTFRSCMESGRLLDAVESDMAEGRAAGVSGTPTFIIGRVANGRLEGVRVVGALPYARFSAKLDEMLAAAKAN